MRKEVEVHMTDALEATPIAHLVALANNFVSRIYLEMDTKKVNAKSIMGMMSLVLTSGSVVTLEVDGDDEAEAMDQVSAFLAGNQQQASA